jgi:hypothetical protein
LAHFCPSLTAADHGEVAVKTDMASTRPEGGLVPMLARCLNTFGYARCSLRSLPKKKEHTRVSGLDPGEQIAFTFAVLPL